MPTVPAEFDLRIDLSGASTAAGIGTAAGNTVQAELNERPTAAALADVTPPDGGSALIGHRPIGRDGPGQTVQTKLDQLGVALPDHLQPRDPGNSTESTQTYRFAYIRALNALGADTSIRTAPDGAPFHGFGRLTIPKGEFHSDGGFDYTSPAFGLDIRGVNQFSSALTTNSAIGYGIHLNRYEGLVIADIYLRNKARGGVPLVTDTSAALLITSTGGAGAATFENLWISGYHTCIKQDPINTSDGDKGLAIRCHFSGQVGYDQGTNKQAVGWTFINCHSALKSTDYKLGGAGETLIVNNTAELYGSFIKYPEGSGNPGSGPTTYFGQRATVMSTKLEYHGTGDRMLVDARESRNVTDSGGSSTEVVLRDVSVEGGTAVPAFASHTIMQVGDTTSLQGSDAIRVRQDGGFIRGVIKYVCHQLLQLHRRWRFVDAVAAPDPATVQFLGPGSHPMMEWARNENVRLDQYRGGQAAQLSIDSQKSYLIPRSGKNLITGANPESPAASGRYGVAEAIPLPNTLRASVAMGGASHALVVQLGLRVYVPVAAAQDTQVTQYTDNTYATPIGGTFTIPAGQVGLFTVHSVQTNVTAGEFYVRITKPASGQTTVGALVFDYFPYLGV
jgi:hypothetical protein